METELDVPGTDPIRIAGPSRIEIELELEGLARAEDSLLAAFAVAFLAALLIGLGIDGSNWWLIASGAGTAAAAGGLVLKGVGDLLQKARLHRELRRIEATPVDGSRGAEMVRASEELDRLSSESDNTAISVLVGFLGLLLLMFGIDQGQIWLMIASLVPGAGAVLGFRADLRLARRKEELREFLDSRADEAVALSAPAEEIEAE